MTRRKKATVILLFVLMLAAGVVLGIYFLLDYDWSPVNRAAYDCVRIGMTKEEVYQVMGSGPTTLRHANTTVLDAEETKPFFKGNVGQETTLANYDNFWIGKSYLIHIDTHEGKVYRKVLFRVEGTERPLLARIVTYIRASLP
jgi:hypothetical protein